MWTKFTTRRQLRACNSVGVDVRLDGAVHITNEGRIELSDRVHVRSSPAMSHLVTGPKGHLRIGENVFIGHGAAIASHESITIGEGVRIGPFAMIMDTDFHEAGKHDSSGSTGAIHIGARARLGARVTVLRGSTIGADAVVAAGSVVKGDIAAGAHVAGVPARTAVLRAADTELRDVTMVEICAVVGSTFGLSSTPPQTATRDDITQWDSLGMLNLLLSLEQEFGVSIANEAMLSVHQIADLLPVLESAPTR